MHIKIYIIIMFGLHAGWHDFGESVTGQEIE